MKMKYSPMGLLLAVLFSPVSTVEAAPALLYEMNQTPVTGTRAIVDAANTNTNFWGTLAGSGMPVLTNGATGYTSNAWDFNGAYIAVGPNAVTRSLGDIHNTPGLTVGFWMNWSNRVAWSRLCGLGGTFDFAVYGHDNQFNFGFGNDINIPAFNFQTDKNSNLFTNGWKHLVVTWDFRRSSTNVMLYIDGVRKMTLTQVPIAPFNSTNSTLNIGARSNGGSPWLGALDQFVVCTNALSVAEVAQLYSSGRVTNYAPIVMAVADQATIVWPANAVNLHASISDDGLPNPPGVVTSLWTQVSGPPGAATFGDATTNHTTVTFSAPGEYVVRRTAGDGQLTDFDDVVVRVITNKPPDIAVWSSQNLLLGTNPTVVTLGGWVQDDGLPNPPGTTTSWWSQAGGPAAVLIANPSVIHTTVTVPTNVGTYQLLLNASDGMATNNATLTLTVVSNIAPTVSAWASRPILQWPANVFTLQAEVADDGRPLVPGAITCAWTSVSGPLTAPGTVTFGNASASNTTATCSLPGVYQFRLTASDGVLSATHDVWVNIWSNSPGCLPPPDMRRFSATPPPYEHPRVLFTDADRPELQARASSDPMVQEGINGMVADTAATIDNPATIEGRMFARLSVGDDTVDTQTAVSDGFYGELLKGCYLAWLRPTNAARLQQLATAVGTAASAQNRWYVSGTHHNLGLCYDLMYDWMSESQRAVTRALISRMFTNVHTYAWGWPDYNRQNWIMEGMEAVLSDLAIEGETGFDAQTTADLREQMRAYCTRWGIMEQGFNAEGMGYFGFGMGLGGAQAGVALSRRGDNLFVTTRLYQSMIQAFYQMPPWLEGNMFDHHDAAGWSGTAPSTIYFVEKFMFPNDPMVDLVFRNAYQGGSHSRIPFYKAIFGVAPSSVYTNYAVTAPASGLPLTKFDAQRGFGTARSDWTADAVQLDFDCRFDTFGTGHMHTDRNAFYLWALGRTWIGDPGYHITENDAHSTVLIDGLGQSGSSPSNKWPSVSARFVEFAEHPDQALFAGDARLTYTYSAIANDPKATTGVKIPERWVDCWYNAPSALDGDDQLMTNNLRVDPNPYNPVQRAFRSATLVRGTKPYVLVVDDIQKDNNPHTYTWVANTIGCDNQTDMALLSGANATNAVLYHASDPTSGQPRLLVRVLDGKGTAGNIQLTDQTLATGTQVKRIEIARANTVAPDFKVLLFPHRRNDALPTTTWSNNVLTVTMSDGQVDRFYFTASADGRSRIARYRIGGANPVLTPPTGLSATAGDGQVRLNWSTKAGASGYNVWRSTVTGGPYSLVASNLTSLVHTNTGLVNGLMHYFVVSALNANGDGEPSAQVGATPNVAGHVAVSLTWEGDGVDNVWDSQNSANLVWRHNGVPVSFFNGDTVTFNDSGSAAVPIHLVQPLLPASNVVVSAAQDYVFIGVGKITGTAGLRKEGAGTLTVLTENDYSGTNLINSGQVRVGDGGTNGSLGGGPVVLNGGGLILDRSDGSSFSNHLSGAGSLTVQGGGTFTLSGANAAYAGPLTVNSGTLTISGASGLGTGSVLVNTGTLATACASMANLSGLTLNGGTLEVTDTANATFNRGLTLSPAGGTIGHSNILTMQSSMTGGGGLTKTGPSTLILTGTNNYSGDTRITAGILQVGNGGAVGVVPTNLVLSGGNFMVNRSNAYVQNGLVYGASTNSTFGNLAGSGPLTLTLGSGSNTFGGLVAMSTNGTLTVRALPDSTNVFVGALRINGGTRLVFDGGLCWFTTPGFGNSGQSGTGSCVVQNGARLYLGNATWLNWTNVLVGGSNSTLQGNGNINLNAARGLVTITNGGTILSANGAILIGSYYGATYSGIQQSVTVNQSSGALLLSGNRTLSMGGASAGTAGYTNLYNLTGGTVSSLGGTGANLQLGADTNGVNLCRFSLTGGKVLVSGTISGAQTAGTPRQMFDFSGGTLVANAITTTWLSSTNAPTSYGSLINNGGTLAPGDFGMPGRTTVTGNYAVSNHAATLAIDLGGTTPATAFTNDLSCHDVLSVTGTAALAGSLKVSLINGFQPAAADSFTILSAASVTGLFTNVSGVPARVPVEGTTNASFEVVYTGTSVVLTNVQLSGGVTPPLRTNITHTLVGGNQWELNWPAGQGWKLQSQTNSLSDGITPTNWHPVTPVPVPPIIILLNPNDPSVFYRLVWP